MTSTAEIRENSDKQIKPTIGSTTIFLGDKVQTVTDCTPLGSLTQSRKQGIKTKGIGGPTTIPNVGENAFIIL